MFDSSPNSTFRVMSDKISAGNRGTWWQGYDDPTAEDRMAAAFAAVAPEDRESAYAAALRYLVRNPPWLCLVHPIVITGVRQGTTGLSLDNRGVLNIS